MNELAIKEWFTVKLENEKGGFLAEINRVVRETEKALLLSVEWGYSSNIEKRMEIWVPKSAMTTKEEIEKEKEEYSARLDKGLEYNKALLDFAKENKVKGVRAGMKTVTLIKKITEAGLVVPTK